jgi:predicted alpha/beta-hydrolase family hydrolase
LTNWPRRFYPASAMISSAAERVSIDVDGSTRVSGLLLLPPAARACYVLGHGAGAGMEHPGMSSVANDLATLGIATLRYQFPYMERRSKRPDPPPLCHATVRAAVSAAVRHAPNLPRIAGGRSFGGRMTSQAQAIAPLDGVLGLAFLAFPLHPAGRPGDERAKHLADVKVPMLFLQGTRDDLARLDLIEAVTGRLAPLATLKLLQDADHSFHVPARTGRKDQDVRTEALQELAAWTQRLGRDAGAR